jgi:alkylated DNA repair dioxygenase AlkB
VGGEAPRRIPDGELLYLPGFLSPAEADALLERLIALPDWERLRLTLFGKAVSAPRLTAWYGDPGARYGYSGIVHEPLPWPDELGALRERLSSELGLAFDSVLANRYRDGGDSMGWHSDDEKELGSHPVIGSISLGAERRFLLRHRTRKDLETLELSLAHGSLLVMRGDTQQHWKHSLPRALRCKDERVNLTFRRVLGPPPD